jgi:hypothetical protein
MLANFEAVSLASISVRLLIEERVRDLEKNKPNPKAKLLEWEKLIDGYKTLRDEISKLEAALAGFKAAQIEEQSAVQTATVFSDGVRKWWNNNPASVRTQLTNVAIFTVSATICTIFGFNQYTTAVTAVALAGAGKEFASAGKALGHMVKIGK